MQAKQNIQAGHNQTLSDQEIGDNLGNNTEAIDKGSLGPYILRK